VQLTEQKLPELGLSDFSDSLRHPILTTVRFFLSLRLFRLAAADVAPNSYATWEFWTSSRASSTSSSPASLCPGAGPASGPVFRGGSYRTRATRVSARVSMALPRECRAYADRRAPSGAPILLRCARVRRARRERRGPVGRAARARPPSARACRPYPRHV